MLVPARPFPYPLAPGATALVVIDMQRDFIEPGGFGASLGNDVSRLVPAIAPIAALLTAWRVRGWTVLHTREAHRADLSDCPPAKRLRGNPRGASAIRARWAGCWWRASPAPRSCRRWRPRRASW